MKRTFSKIPSLIIAFALALTLILFFGIVSFAEDENLETEEAVTEQIEIEEESKEQSENINNDSFSSENTEEGKDNFTNSSKIDTINEENVFDQLYKKAEENADKIFAILAFIGTLVVGIGYKSGLIPMLRDAFTRLKSSIDGARNENKEASALTDKALNEMSLALEDMRAIVDQSEERLEKIDLSLADVEEQNKEREALRIILQGQVDMLYAIFMSSALPQYQKDQVGEYVGRMREELKLNGKSEEN